MGAQPDRIPADIRDAVQIMNFTPAAKALEGWQIVEEYSHRTKIRRGPVTFQHGCSTGKTAEKDAAYDYGTPFGLYICGHTHRPLEVTRAEERGRWLPYWYANPGTGICFKRCHYMDRLSMAKWGRGCIVGEIPASSVRESRTAYASKNWDAELRTHSFAHE